MAKIDEVAAQGGSSASQRDDLALYASKYGSALSRYFRRRGANESAVEDLVQDVFVRLATRAQGGPIENAQGYLMQTAASVWVDYLRLARRRHHNDHDQYDEERSATEVSCPARVLEGRETVEAIVRLLADLPERTRQVYLLCKVAGKKRSEVASQMGITTSAVDKHLIQAVKQVGKLLGSAEK